MTGYEFDINGNNVPEYFCTICLLLLKRALLLPCSHTACHECLSNWEDMHPEMENKCPTCNEPYDSRKVREGKQGQFIDRIVTSSLSVKCKQHRLDCDWTGTICGYNNHKENCSFLQVQCVLEGCEEMIQRNLMEDHRMACPCRIIPCSYCDTDVVHRELEIHLQSCSECKVTCTNNECEVEVKQRELHDHVENVCQYTVIPCSFCEFGCDSKILRRDSERHVIQNAVIHSSLMLRKAESSKNQLHSLIEQKLQEQRQQFSQQLHLHQKHFYKLQEQQQQMGQLTEYHEEHIEEIKLVQESHKQQFEQQREWLQQEIIQKQQEMQKLQEFEQRQKQLGEQMHQLLEDIEQDQQQRNKLQQQLQQHLQNCIEKVGNQERQFDLQQEQMKGEVHELKQEIQTLAVIIQQQQDEQHHRQQFLQRILRLEQRTRGLELEQWTFPELKEFLENRECHKFNEIIIGNPDLINLSGQLRSKKSISLLHCACAFGRFSCVDTLLKYPVNVVQSTEDGWQPIHFACRGGTEEHERIVGCLIFCDPTIVHSKNKYGELPIHLACESGHTNIAQMLLCIDQSMINVKTNTGWTPLHLASMHEHAETVQWILNQANVDVTIEDKWGETADEMTNDPAVQRMIQKKINEKKMQDLQ